MIIILFHFFNNKVIKDIEMDINYINVLGDFSVYLHLLVANMANSTHHNYTTHHYCTPLSWDTTY